MISQNTWNTKLEAGLEGFGMVKMAENTANCVSQKRKAK